MRPRTIVTTDPHLILEPNSQPMGSWRECHAEELVLFNYRRAWRGCSKSFHLKCFMGIHTGLTPSLLPLRRDVTEEEEKLYKCLNCGVEFVHRHTLNRHLHQRGLVKLLTHIHVKIGSVDWRWCWPKKKKSPFSRSLCSAQRLLNTEFSWSRESTFWRARFYMLKVQQGLFSHPHFRSLKKIFFCRVSGKGCNHQSPADHHMWTHTWEKTRPTATWGSMQRNQGKSLQTVCSETYRRSDRLKCVSQVCTHEASHEDPSRRKTQRVQETPEESPDSLGWRRHQQSKTFHTSQHWSVYMSDTRIQKTAANSHYITYEIHVLVSLV